VVFDEPSWGSQYLPFELRYSSLLSSVPYGHPSIVSLDLNKWKREGRGRERGREREGAERPVYAFLLYISFHFIFDFMYIVASRLRCESLQEMNKFLSLIIKDEGEGIVLRKPKSVYEQGRSPSLLKIKVFYLPLLSFSLLQLN